MWPRRGEAPLDFAVRCALFATATSSLNSGTDAVSDVVVGFCRPLGAPDVVETMAPDAKILRTIKEAGGCALQCAGGCLGTNAAAATSQSWRGVPAGAPVKNKSGWSCNPCRKALDRQPKKAAPSKPSEATVVTRSKRLLSPNRGPGMSPGSERAPPSRRSEAELLAKGGYKAGRPYEPRRDVAEPSANRRDEHDDDFSDSGSDESVDDAASIAPPGSATEGMAVEGTAPAHADEGGFKMVRGQGKKLTNMSPEYLRRECAHWRAREGELLRREARATELEKKEAQLVKEVAKNEAAAAARARDADDTIREDARRKLSLNGLADFPHLFYMAIVSGVLRLATGSKNIFALFLNTAAVNMNAGFANLFTYPTALADFYATARSLSSAKAAVDFFRGPMGFGTGDTAPPVNAELKYNFFGVTSDEHQRATLRRINPADDGDGEDAKVGIFTGAIAGFCALGGGILLKADETDISAGLGETSQLQFHGDEDFTAIDARAYDPAPLQKQLLALCAPSKKFLEDDDPADVPAIVKSFRAARKFVSDSQPRFQQQIENYEAQHAKLLDKYRRRRQKSAAGPRKTELHNNQYTNLMKVTKRIVDAQGAMGKSKDFIALVDKLLPACDSDDQHESMAALVRIASAVLDVVPLAVRLLRVPATKLLAVFLHATDHTRFRCVARFFLAKPLKAVQMRLLYDKLREMVVAAEVNSGAQPLVLHGLGADGAYTSMLDGQTRPTNLQQLGKAARAVADTFVKERFAVPRGARGISAASKVSLLHGAWRSTVVATASASRNVSPPRTPDIFGWVDEPVARDPALGLWAQQRRRTGEASSRDMHAFLRARYAQAPEEFLYRRSGVRGLPPEERVVLDALLSLRPPPLLPQLARLHQLWNLQFPNLGAFDSFAFFRHHRVLPTQEQILLEAAFQWATMVLRDGRLGDVASEADVVKAALAAFASAEMDRQRTLHPRLGGHCYAPEPGGGLFHECCSHKIKNLLQGLQNQREDNDTPSISAGGPESWPLRLSVLDKAADVEPPHVGMKGFCCDAFDRHMDGPYNGLASSETVKQRLLGEGSYAAALVLDIIAEAQQAWTMGGLDQTERTVRLWRFSFMNFCLFGESLFLPHALTGNDGRRIQGLVPNSLLAMHANADGRVAFLRGASSATRGSLVEKCFSNVPDLECYFSLLVKRCTFKPDARTAEGAFRTIDAVMTIKSDLDREFFMYMSKRSKHDIEDHVKAVVVNWNDGSCLDPKSAAKKSYVAELEDKLEKACDVRVATIREQFKRVATDVS